jgi:uncharacterized membrane protein (UPF0127 family)
MNSNKARLLIILFVVVAVTLVGYLTTVNYESRVVVKGKTYNIDVSDTAYTKTKGLSGRKYLSQNQGMIFLFENEDKHSFWMKDMNFSIDIIWIDKNFVVNHIEKAVSPQTYPKVFAPETPSLYVLELASGQADLIGLKVGDTVEFYK